MRNRIIFTAAVAIVAYIIGAQMGRASARPEPARLQMERVIRRRRTRRARARAGKKAKKLGSRASRAVARARRG